MVSFIFFVFFCFPKRKVKAYSYSHRTNAVLSFWLKPQRS